MRWNIPQQIKLIIQTNWHLQKITIKGPDQASLHFSTKKLTRNHTFMLPWHYWFSRMKFQSSPECFRKLKVSLTIVTRSWETILNHTPGKIKLTPPAYNFSQPTQG